MPTIDALPAIDITLLEFMFLFLAALAAGGLNAVAGGGSFFSFPTLIAVGVPSIQANATNTVALWPGVVSSSVAYRKTLHKLRDRLLRFGAVSLIGGGVGAWLLLNTPESTFERLIPFLLLLATAIFATSPRINAWLRSQNRHPLENNIPAQMVLQFVIGIYGGYFGGGIGIMMLALLAISGMDDLNEANALKLVLNTLINGVAIIIFVVAGQIVWAAAGVMIVGAVLGGYGGALAAQRVDQKYVRRFVVTVGALLSVYFFYKYWIA
jgi:uncharacterized protein